MIPNHLNSLLFLPPYNSPIILPHCQCRGWLTKKKSVAIWGLTQTQHITENKLMVQGTCNMYRWQWVESRLMCKNRNKKCICNRTLYHWAIDAWSIQPGLNQRPFEFRNLEIGGIEPPTSRMQSEHSTPELNPLPSTPTGLEPARRNSKRFLISRLNHSATVSFLMDLLSPISLSPLAIPSILPN